MQAVDPNKRLSTRLACAPHSVPMLREEVSKLGFEVQGEDHSGVQVGATLFQCMTLALCLRTAVHVLWTLMRFRCPSAKALYRGIAAFPWERVIPMEECFTIRSSVDHPSIDNDLYANRLVKDAIADRFVQRMGQRPDSGPDRSGVVVHLYWKGDRAEVYLNVNGRSLSDRGYRRIPLAAPMRETLAASVLLAGGYDATTPLVNPMCGSGTLAIEAALIATGRAPGLLRSDYAVLRTALDVGDAWQAARASARRGARPAADPLPDIVATDHDPAAIDAAQKNAAVAGVDHLIRFMCCDFAETPLPSGPGGHIVLNPEYGERLGEIDGLAATYTRIGDFFKRRCAGWTGHVFTGSRELSKRIGLRSARRTPFMNGGIECRLLSYALYEGSRAAARE